YLHLEFRILRDAPSPFALLAQIGHHLPRTSAVATRARHSEEALLEADLSASLALRTRRRRLAALRAAAIAVRTHRLALHVDLLRHAEDGLFERQLQVEAQIVAALRARTTPATHPPTATEEIAEQIAEDLGDIDVALEAASAEAVPDSRVPKAV